MKVLWAVTRGITLTLKEGVTHDISHDSWVNWVLFDLSGLCHVAIPWLLNPRVYTILTSLPLCPHLQPSFFPKTSTSTSRALQFTDASHKFVQILCSFLCSVCPLFTALSFLSHTPYLFVFRFETFQSYLCSLSSINLYALWSTDFLSFSTGTQLILKRFWYFFFLLTFVG